MYYLKVVEKVLLRDSIEGFLRVYFVLVKLNSNLSKSDDFERKGIFSTTKVILSIKLRFYFPTQIRVATLARFCKNGVKNVFVHFFNRCRCIQQRSRINFEGGRKTGECFVVKWLQPNIFSLLLVTTCFPTTWSFNRSCPRRLASWLELSSQVGETTDHLARCCFIQRTEGLSSDEGWASLLQPNP